MRWTLVVLLLAVATALCQDVNFEELAEGDVPGDVTETPEDNVGLRLGLLANSLGVDPLASGGGQSPGRVPPLQQPQQQQQQQQAAGRLPPAGSSSQQQCCCVSQAEPCGDALGREDIAGSGAIDPRVRDPEAGISVRIVNRPLPNNKEEINSCPPALKSCCYDSGTV